MFDVFNFINRLLQISSFNGKMNALNEVNKVISSVSYYTHRHNPEEEEWLTAERMAVSSAYHFLPLGQIDQRGIVVSCAPCLYVYELWTKPLLP